MGCAVSLQLEEVLREARCKAVRENQDQVGEILFNNENFKRSLQELWKAVPADCKKQLTEDVPRRRTHHQPILERLNLTTPPTKILKQLLTWKADPRSFLYTEEKTRPTNGRFLTRIFALLCELEDSHILNQIRRRISLLLIHNLAKTLSPKARLSDTLQEVFANLIIQSGLLNGDHVTAQNKFTEWRYNGARYDTFAQELDGLGSVLLLPYEVSHYEWERKIPKTGDQHTKIVESLRRQGICEKALKEIDVPDDANPSRTITTNIHNIATELYDYLWNELAFEENLWLEQVRANEAVNKRNEAANKRLEALMAAVTSVSSAEPTSQGNTTTFNTHDHAQQVNQHLAEPGSYTTFNGHQENQVYIHPGNDAAFIPPDNYTTFNGHQENQVYIRPGNDAAFIPPDNYTTFNGHQENQVYIRPGNDAAFIPPLNCAPFVNFTCSNASNIRQQTNSHNNQQTEDNPMLCDSAGYV